MHKHKEREIMKPNSSIFALSCAAVLLTLAPSHATSIYDNNISALNINMLTDVFMSYANHGDKMSDLFAKRDIYGTMDRFDEYGDDGSTISGKNVASSGKYLVNNVWFNANHINEHMHYGQDITQHGRFNLATVGATTQKITLKYGDISFGGFISYINTKMPDFHGGGTNIGLFSDYKYRRFGAKLLLNTGSLNNGAVNANFNNSWTNIATDINTVLKIDETFLFRPDVYIGYTYVSSDDLYVDGARVHSKDFNFFNIAPGAAFIKEISPNWYGRLSARYVAHFGGKNDINIDDTSIRGLYLDNHTDIGIDAEYNFQKFVFGANIHKQIGGLDGWSTNINVKYAF